MKKEMGTKWESKSPKDSKEKDTRGYKGASSSRVRGDKPGYAKPRLEAKPRVEVKPSVEIKPKVEDRPIREDLIEGRNAVIESLVQLAYPQSSQLISPRTPWGPSDIHNSGMPSLSTPGELNFDCAWHMATFSSKVKEEIILSILVSIAFALLLSWAFIIVIALQTIINNVILKVFLSIFFGLNIIYLIKYKKQCSATLLFPNSY